MSFPGAFLFVNYSRHFDGRCVENSSEMPHNTTYGGYFRHRKRSVHSSVITILSIGEGGGELLILEVNLGEAYTRQYIF